ncbi:hypothetical protein [Mucilaginibacter arboris]|uniref:Uncharacterized protein n=1 Tax=Mucilaginibacter arboris TaxID=2682090 RepID=A0A7K1T1M2_9SPHI|nr:hypothetical protein [Mucilaginibacter arboris]MVN23454.1 hypothetical protein [Mucilaginibacter arboris]
MEHKNDVALIIVFNHRYDKNIEVLEKIYKERFSYIYYLVPFYDGNKPNVISVYENSYYFQGYFVQGFKQYFHDRFLHYFFVADDIVLNPDINENNYQQHFSLSGSASFIPEVYSLDNINDNMLYCSPATIKDGIAKLRNKNVKKWNWCRVWEAYHYNPQQNGVESTKELPGYEEALSLLKRHGININQLSYVDVFGGPKVPNSFKFIIKNINYIIGEELLRLKYKLKYPLAGSYSDIVIVSHQSIKKFIHYCGVFTATKLFVELAIPTALLLASGDVATEPKIGKRGQVFWPYSKKRKRLYQEEMEKYNYKLDNLISLFPKEKLYIHPIKLSKWK